MSHLSSLLLMLCLAAAPVSPVAAATVHGEPAACAAAAPLDLNQADAGQLDELPGIGPALAERIIAWRDESGPFTSIEQLGEVRGIGVRTMEKLRPCLKVE